MSDELALKVVWGGDTRRDLVSVPVEEGEVILNAVLRWQPTQVGDLAVRWNCTAGKCGSCSAEINGRPKLMGMTRLSTLPTGPVTVTPLRALPGDPRSHHGCVGEYRRAQQIPAFTPPTDMPPGGYRMAQRDVERSHEFRKCIECWLCQDVCDVIRDHEDNKPAYSGPRFFIRYAELDMHPMDRLDRRERIHGQGGLGLCNATKCCTEICSAYIKITDDAIIPMEEQVIDERYAALRMLMPHVRRRPGRHSDVPDTDRHPHPEHEE